MKNFDLDQLEKKNIYKTQENLFQKVQDNVLEHISNHQKVEIAGRKVFKFNFGYAVAASVALVAGIIGFNQFGDQSLSIKQSPKIEQNRVVATTSSATDAATKATVQKEDTPLATSPVAVAVQPEIDHKPAKTIVSTKENKVVKPIKRTATTTNKTIEVQMQEILASFSTAEIADLSKGADQDVYLDLYK